MKKNTELKIVLSVLLISLLIITPILNITPSVRAGGSNIAKYLDYASDYPVPDYVIPGDFIRINFKKLDQDVTWLPPYHFAVYVGNFEIDGEKYENIFVEAGGGGFEYDKDFWGNPIDCSHKCAYAEFLDQARDINGIVWYRVGELNEDDNRTRTAAVNWLKDLANDTVLHQPYYKSIRKELYDKNNHNGTYADSLYCNEIVWCAYMQCNEIDINAKPINIDRGDKGDLYNWTNDLWGYPVITNWDLSHINNKYITKIGTDNGIFLSLRWPHWID